MPELTEQGRRIVNELSARHGFSADAVQHMMIAVMNGNGTMAQFSHPEFAGSGQWMQGGMTMIGDMFNGYLKGRIESLCSNIAGILQQEGLGLQSGSFQSQSQSGTGHQSQTAGGSRGNSSLFAPDPNQNWWPQELGNPSATGSQNQTQYAYFANASRLAVKTGSSIWVYDTLDHQIGGFSQQQGSSGGMSFTSQYGTVNLNSLRVVMRDGQTVSSPTVSTPIPLAPLPLQAPTSEVTAAPSAIHTQPAKPITSEIDIFAAIEKLGELKTKGILTDEEFSEKKRELLLRI
jgi:hypothetical protein